MARPMPWAPPVTTAASGLLRSGVLSMLDEGSVAVFAEGQFKFLPCVHDDGAAPGHRFFQGAARNQDEPEIGSTGPDPDLIAGTEINQVIVLDAKGFIPADASVTFKNIGKRPVPGRKFSLEGGSGRIVLLEANGENRALAKSSPTGLGNAAKACRSAFQPLLMISS